MILTQGEKMVWAAAFVASINQCGVIARKNEVACAVVDACGAVLALRMEMPPSGDSYRPSEEAMQMLRAMLGDEVEGVDR